VNLIGGERQRGGLFDHLRIKLVAALHLAEAHAFARGRQIFVAQEIAQAFVRLVNVPGLGLVSGGKAILVRLREIVRKDLERPHELRILHRDTQLRIELLDYPVDGQLGLDDT